VHDFTYEKFVKGPAQWVHSWQKNRSIRNSDIVICVSDNTANDLLRYCPIDESKIRVIHNGVSDSYYPLASQITSNEVLFIGARAGYKNFQLAIKAVKHNPDLILSVVGGGSFSKGELNLLNHHLGHRYQWLGRLTELELNDAYNRAYALLYPSSYEGFGIPVIEAMRAGCPVVSTKSSSIPEVGGSAAILVDHIDEASFINALSSVENRRFSLKMTGFDQANKFSWEKTYNETLNVYNELI
jgi:mannosyltransferase